MKLLLENWRKFISEAYLDVEFGDRLTNKPPPKISDVVKNENANNVAIMVNLDRIVTDQLKKMYPKFKDIEFGELKAEHFEDWPASTLVHWNIFLRPRMMNTPALRDYASQNRIPTRAALDSFLKAKGVS